MLRMYLNSYEFNDGQISRYIAASEYSPEVALAAAKCPKFINDLSI